MGKELRWTNEYARRRSSIVSFPFYQTIRAAVWHHVHQTPKPGLYPLPLLSPAAKNISPHCQSVSPFRFKIHSLSLSLSCECDAIGIWTGTSTGLLPIFHWLPRTKIGNECCDEQWGIYGYVFKNMSTEIVYFDLGIQEQRLKGPWKGKKERKLAGERERERD